MKQDKEGRHPRLSLGLGTLGPQMRLRDSSQGGGPSPSNPQIRNPCSHILPNTFTCPGFGFLISKGIGMRSRESQGVAWRLPQSPAGERAWVTSQHQHWWGCAQG